MAPENDQEKNRADFLLVSTGIPLSAAEKNTISEALKKTFQAELAKIDHSSKLVPDTLANLPRARGGGGVGLDDFLTIGGKGTSGVVIRKPI